MGVKNNENASGLGMKITENAVNKKAAMEVMKFWAFFVGFIVSIAIYVTICAAIWPPLCLVVPVGVFICVCVSISRSMYEEEKQHIKREEHH